MTAVVIGILTGLVSLIGAAIPVYFKWKKYHDEESKTVDIAGDDSRVDAWRKRMRKRLAGNQAGSGSHAAESEGNPES